MSLKTDSDGFLAGLGISADTVLSSERALLGTSGSSLGKVSRRSSLHLKSSRWVGHIFPASQRGAVMA